MKKLKKQLGEMDAFTQYIELALRSLEKGYNAEKMTYNQYVKATAAEFGVNLHNIDIKNYKQKIILRHLAIFRDT